MADEPLEDFRKYNRSEEEEDQTNRFLLTALVLVLIVIVAYRTLALQPIDDAGNTNELAFITNVVTEGLSIFITVLIIGEFQQRRDRRRQADESAERERLALEQLKKELLADVAYGSNSDAIRAINRMHVYDEEYGWLSGENGLLCGQWLPYAKLQNTKLWGANLKGTNLWGANLSNSNLRRANLEGANLASTNLTEANLSDSNLRSTNLSSVNLQEAYMVGANLEGADLGGARLQGAILRTANMKSVKLDGTEFSETTILPDKVVIRKDSKIVFMSDNYYVPEKGVEQMRRYTDPTYDGRGGFWDPCKELTGDDRPWYCDDAHEPTP